MIPVAAPRRLLGLFPTLATIGGVQASGRVAWDGILASQRWGPASSSGTALRFCHCGPDGGRLGCPDSGAVHGTSRLDAVRLALRQRWPADLVLIWHIGLLKLLPLFRPVGAKVALFLHGVEAWRRPDPLTRALLNRVDLFLTNSDHTWQRFIAFSPRQATAAHRTAHLGLGTPLVGACPPPPAQPAALMLGRLARDEDYKGHRQVISAWPEVLERSPAAQLWIVGHGDLRPDLEALATASKLGSAVRFFGQVGEAEKQTLLARSTCLALPSRGEGFGLVYLEALRLGRPCLVSTLDAGREVIAPPIAGLTADPDQPAGLAEALSRLLAGGPAWQAWSAAARARYEADFTALHFQRRLLAALEELVEADQPAPLGVRRS